MTYAPITFQDDGNRTYQIPFPYLAADHVRVSVNGMAATADQFTIDGNTLDWTGGGFESHKPCLLYTSPSPRDS